MNRSPAGSEAVLARAGVLLLLALTAQGCRTTPAPQDLRLIRSQGGGTLHACGSQTVLTLRGSHYEMGKQHGALLGAAVRSVTAETLDWTAAKGLPRDRLAAIWAELEPHLPQCYRDELRGLADGSGTPLQDLQWLHAMPSKFHCSGAAAAGAATRDGKLYHARSLDYALDIGVTDRLQNHALLIARYPNEGIPSVVPAWAGFLGAVTGMNLRGISVGEKGAASDDESFAGMPMIFTVREVLRRGGDLESAVAIFRNGPRTCGFNFIVGSGEERQAVALEVTRNHFAVFGFGDPAEDVPPHRALANTVRRTNHFVSPELARTQPRRGEDYHPEHYLASSWQRYQRITTFLEAAAGTLDAAAMIRMLRGYPPRHACLHQAVMCPTDRVLWVSQAADDRRSAIPGAQNQRFYGYRMTDEGLESLLVEPR